MEETQYTEDSNHDLGHNTCDPETQHDYTREDNSLFISAQIEKQDKVRGHVGQPSIRVVQTFCQISLEIHLGHRKNIVDIIFKQDFLSYLRKKGCNYKISLRHLSVTVTNGNGDFGNSKGFTCVDRWKNVQEPESLTLIWMQWNALCAAAWSHIWPVLVAFYPHKVSAFILTCSWLCWQDSLRYRKTFSASRKILFHSFGNIK